MTTEPRKIIIAVHHFPPTFKGGAEWRAHRTAKWMQQQGHEVKVICVDAVDGSGPQNLTWVDDMFDGLPVRRLYLNLAEAPDKLRWEYDNPWVETHLNQYLEAEMPDMVHLISGYLLTAGAIRAIKNQQLPLVATLTDFWFICPRHTLQRTRGELCPQNEPLDCVRCHYELQRRFRLPAQKWPDLSDRAWQGARYLPPVAEKVAKIEHRAATLKAALKQIDVAIGPSNFLLNMYAKRGYAAQEMRFMRQGLKNMPPTPPERTTSDKIRVGYIGGIAPHKGVHVLVEAFLQLQATCPQAELKLYGDTSKFAEFAAMLQAQAADNEQVRFMGTFDNQKISEIHAELDLLVVPSTWYENSPNVILEAQAHRTPIITSNLGGMAELVAHEETGLLFAPNDAADLAQKLQFVCQNPDVLQQWQANLQPPKTLETEMKELWQVYQTVLSN